jgi:hypothetical protein
MDRSNVDSLLALATDVLAQSEARQRAARRLHQTAHDVHVSLRGGVGLNALQMQKLRDHTSAIRELGDAERSLLDEFESALAQLNR